MVSVRWGFPQGLGSVLHAASAQCVFMGTKLDIHHGRKNILENSPPWSGPFPGGMSIQVLSFPKKYLKILPKSLQRSVYSSRKCCG